MLRLSQSCLIDQQPARLKMGSAEELVGLVEDTAAASTTGTGGSAAAGAGFVAKAAALLKSGLSWGIMFFVLQVAASQGWLPFLSQPPAARQPPVAPRSAAPRLPPKPASSSTVRSGNGAHASSDHADEQAGQSAEGSEPMDEVQTTAHRACKTLTATCVRFECPSPPLPESQAAHAAAVEALLGRAKQHASDMKHSKLSIDHMVLALAENPRCEMSPDTCGCGGFVAGILYRLNVYISLSSPRCGSTRWLHLCAGLRRSCSVLMA
jgi:hypothetical protein